MAENKNLEGYKISTMEDEEDYFDNVEMELDYSISITEGSMEPVSYTHLTLPTNSRV